MPFSAPVVSPAASFQGQRVTQPGDVVDSFVSEEVSAEIPFGVMVKRGAAVGGALKLTAITDVLAGIVCHSHSYAKPEELGDVGLKPKVSLSVLRRGDIWVHVEEAVTPASSVFVRAVVAGNEVAGDFRDTADATDLIDCSAFAEFLGSTAGAGLVLVRVDMTNRRA